jgi:hypothetical protein
LKNTEVFFKPMVVAPANTADLESKITPCDNFIIENEKVTETVTEEPIKCCVIPCVFENTSNSPQSNTGINDSGFSKSPQGEGWKQEEKTLKSIPCMSGYKDADDKKNIITENTTTTNKSFRDNRLGQHPPQKEIKLSGSSTDNELNVQLIRFVSAFEQWIIANKMGNKKWQRR